MNYFLFIKIIKQHAFIFPFCVHAFVQYKVRYVSLLVSPHLVTCIRGVNTFVHTEVIFVGI